ncbi:BrnA antitoxin family protein [Sandarakinorhabdus sp.]|uniref:BrnA antitoxin family protein n=1 Tax=Sandarakinorhabdus sp. TaxID=1916663 RepID=UPI00286E0CF0|nr:BrnA antitoxin family protein [Sandarakinorhabdus sp.]
MSDWQDPDDAPVITRAIAERGDWRVDGKVVKPATGTYRRAGRPPQGDQPKSQVTLRLDADVLARFRAEGPGWQSRINAILRKAVGA